MATGDLASALAALQFAPTETPYGLAGATLAQSLPSLITPTTKPAQALGITLGGALIASLLGYQGQKQATQMGLEAAKQGARLAELPTATERAAYIESLPDVTGRTQIQNALLQYNQQLAGQDILAKALANQEVAKQKALAQFELGPIGTELAKVSAQRAGQKQAAEMLGLGQAIETPEGQAGLEAMAAMSRAKGAGVTERLLYGEEQKALRQLFAAKQLGPGQLESTTTAARLGVNLQDLQKDLKDLSYLQIKTMIETGISPEDKPGLAQKFEQIQQLYRKPEFGATLTGNELKSSETVFGKNLAATKEDMLSALNSLAKGQFAKAELTIQAKQKGPEALLNAIKRAQITGELTLDSTETPVTPMPTPDPIKAGQAFMSSLKAKYGSNWKVRLTDNEKATLTALVNSVKGQ